FILKTKELSLEGPLIEFSSKFLKSFTRENYEMFNPKSWEEVLSFKPNFFRLITNLPRDSVITPGTQHLYENYVDFVKLYGNLFLISFLKYKITGDIVGCFFSIPNPFRKNKSDIYDSVEAFIILLEKEHQGKGLGWLFSLFSAKKGWDNNIRWNSTPIENKVKRSLKTFKAKSILLLENGNITGHVLMFNENDEILYFGYFGALNHEKNKISFLMNSLIDYGKLNKFSKIIGPINIPTFIY
ncbi:unnamed protein product, partial [marine sediment metagenome]